MDETKTVEIEAFTSSEFGDVRIIREENNFLFCASDVARALGYARPNDAVLRHCRAAVKRRSPISGKIQEINFIPESDLYRLIIFSKLPSAEKFEHWVFEEVLPCIRKHGAYFSDSILAQVLQEPELIYQMAAQMLDEHQKCERLQTTLEKAKPKLKYFDTFISPDDCTNIRTTAKELGVPEKKFSAFLKDHGYLFRTPAGMLLPYAKPKNNGLFIVRDFYYGRGQIGAYTLITPNGKAYFQKKVPNIISHGG